MTTSAVLAEPPAQTGQQTDPQSGLVSEDALRTLALSAQPFSSEIADGDWFSDNTTREQLVDVKEALINGEDLLLITGESGSGKSVLLKQLSGSGGSRVQCFSVRGSERFSTANLFTGLLEAFKLKPPANLEDTLKDVIPCLQALAERNMLGVIVLDDADLVSDQELSLLLGSLQYLNGGEDSLLRVLLAAKPEFESRIPGLLASTSELPYATLAIEPFDIGRSAAYLEHRLNKVGTFSESPFTEPQLLSICQLANGLPSGLNTVAAAEINAFHLGLSSDDAAIAANVQEGAANQSQRDQSSAAALATGSVLQSQPLRMVLGLSAVAMLATAAWLFVNPNSPTGEDNGFAIVSKSPVTPITVEPKKPELITLVQEPTASVSASTDPNAAPSENALVTPAVGEQAQTDQQPASPTQTVDTTAQAEALTETPASDAEPASLTAEKVDETTAEPLAIAAAAPGNPAADASSDVAAAINNEQPSTAAQTTASTTPETAPTPASAPETTPSSAAAAPEAAANALPLESANWVLVQDRELYTVQMSASDDRKDVEDFLKRSRLDAPNSIFSFKRGDNTWFALVHGLYPTITDARNAIESMPNSAKANQPWIRAISQIQDSVKSN